MDNLADSQTPPIFPPEIEHTIFDLAARAHRENIPTLGLVAQRVRHWVRPIQHEVLSIDTEDGYLQTRSIGKFVRYMLLQLHIPEFATHLADCPNVENLAIWRDFDCPNLAELIRVLPLRRLSIEVEQLFDGERLDFRQYPFPNLTHLEIMDFLDSWSHISEISLLPNLTHLAYNYCPTSRIVVASLQHCKRLRVLVIIDQDAENILLGEELPRDEYRVVMGIEQVSDWSHDWYKGATGGEDFWVRAEAAVAMRMREGDKAALTD